MSANDQESTAGAEGTGGTGGPSRAVPLGSDVARLAGVSRSAVSHVLRGRAEKMRIPEETARRVLAAAAELGYQPHPLASALRSGRTGMLGFVSNVVPPYYGLGNLLFSLEDAARAAGYRLLTASARGEQDREDELVRSLIGQRVDGLIVSHPRSADSLRLAAESGMAAVAVIPWFAPRPDTYAVEIDAHLGGVLGTRHLLELEHRRIGFIGSPIPTYSHSARLDGYRAAHDEAGIGVDEALVRLGPYSEAHGRQLTQELLDLPDPPTAIFVTSDASVLGALQAIAERGLHVPRDVSVVSFDDFIAAHMVPPLTAVAQPFDPLAAAAIRLLDAQLGSGNGANGARGAPQHLRLPPTLVTRASCGPPAGSSK